MYVGMDVDINIGEREPTALSRLDNGKPLVKKRIQASIIPHAR